MPNPSRDVGADIRAVRVALENLAVALNRRMTPDSVRVYLWALRDIPVPRLLAAIEAATKTCRFFPSPAEIRDLAEGEASRHADEAWQQVWRAISGHSLRPALEADPVISDALRLVGGWSRLGQTNTDAEPHERRRWHEAYATALRRRAVDERTLEIEAASAPIVLGQSQPRSLAQ